MIGTIFSKLFSIIMLALFALSVLMLILTYRKPKKVKLRSLGITLGISLLSMVIFSAVIGYQASFWVWFSMALIGGAIGWFWARATQVYVENNEVLSRNSIWYIVVWGGVFALNQLVTIVTNRPPGIAMAMLILSTFIVWGTTGNVFRRYLRMQPTLTMQPAGAAAFGSRPLAGPVDQGYSYTPQPASPQAAAPVLPQVSPQAKPIAPPPVAAPPPFVPTSPFEEVLARFAAIKSELDRGAINRDAFQHQVSELRFQDASGAWWQIAEDGQGWLKWDGTIWVKHESK